MTTLGIQVDGNNSQRSLIITEINPEQEYYIQAATSVVYSTYTTLTFSGTPFVADAYNEMVLLILNGAARGKCYTIQDTTTSTIVVYEDATSDITTSTYLAVIHTAKTMYDYCVSNSKDCFSISCDSFALNEGSNENPLSQASHTTYRLGTGVYNQGVTFNQCDVWDVNPTTRAWKFGQIRNLVYHWNKIAQQTAVYCIMTVEHIDSNGIYLYHNIDFFNPSDYTDIECRGYLKGFPLKLSSTYTWGAVFNLTFMEAWLL